jgi:hypothetical protein
MWRRSRRPTSGRQTGERSRSPRTRRIALTGIAFAAVTAGCVIGESPGSQVWAVNESDQDVVVTSQLHGGSYVLPSHTFGKMFDSYADPDDDILVFDDECHPLATLPLKVALETVHISVSGVPDLTGDDPGVVPAGVGRAPRSPSGGDLFEARSCS